MPEFAVILEDMIRGGSVKGSIPDHNTRRIEKIEADDLEDAWTKARQKYYVDSGDAGLSTQIMDIKSGDYELPPPVLTAPGAEEPGGEPPAGTEPPATNGGTT